jgi:hypothetical protein
VVLARAASQPVDTLYYNVRAPGAGSSGQSEFAGWQSLDLTRIGAAYSGQPGLCGFAE